MLTMQPTLKISLGLGSSVEASCCVARQIFLSPAIPSSSARTLDSRPTTKGVIMKGKMTTSRIGIIGRRLVSDFSFEVSILYSRRATGTVHYCSASVLLKETGARETVLLLTDDRSSTGDSKDEASIRN